MNSGLILNKANHIATLTIANPPANTWTESSLTQLVEIINDLNADPDNYALIIVGEGKKFFSAGADVKVFADGNMSAAQAMAQAFGNAFESLANYQGVSIAAINGYAMGGGLECALACDIRIAEQQAILALPEAKLGLLPCGCGTQNLPWLVGEGWAKRMILCGEQVDASKALEIGLVEEVVKTGEALSTAVALAIKVKQQSPMAVKACKRLIMAARHNPMQAALPLERELFCQLFTHKDQQEGVQAFLEKRKPVWQKG